MLEENFFQFNLLDYLDFITGDAESSSLNYEDYEELKIYELNSAGSFTQVILPDFDDIVFCGAAIVREGDELSIMGVFGNKLANFKGVGEIRLDTIPPARREFVGDGPWDLSAELLFDDENFYPLLALARIDGRSKTIQAQYVMHELKSNYRVVTDDPSVQLDILEADPSGGPRTIQKSLEELKQYRHLFDLLYNLLQLPRFRGQREDDFRVERHPTKFRTRDLSRTIQKIRAVLELRYTPNYRDVLTLAQSDRTPETSTFENVGLRFETSGFWKTLPLGKLGADKHGNNVYGKTWVEQKLSWREVDAAVSVATSRVGGGTTP